MNEQSKERWYNGIVRAFRYVPDPDLSLGKQFLGAIVECNDGNRWVIDYDEQSPFHAFADRHVVFSGEPYEPEPTGGQHIGMAHFRVRIMRLAKVTPDAEILEVRSGQPVSGSFKHATTDTGERMLSFVANDGNTFLVANDPAGATTGRKVEVFAYPVQLSPSIRKPPAQYLWIICPYSAAELWEWRKRHS